MNVTFTYLNDRELAALRVIEHAERVEHRYASFNTREDRKVVNTLDAIGLVYAHEADDKSFTWAHVSPPGWVELHDRGFIR